jgi:hypothetical protein
VYGSALTAALLKGIQEEEWFDMPSSSKKQHNFMEMVAHNPSFAKKVGVPQSVGQEFSKADKGRTFKQGGNMAHSKQAHHMKMAHHHLKMAMGGDTIGMETKDQSKGMTTAKMGKLKEGGIKKHGEHSVQEHGHTKARMPKMAGSTTGMKRGGMARHKK